MMKKRVLLVALIGVMITLGMSAIHAHSEEAKACCGQAQKKACAAGCAKPCCAQKKACCGQAQKKACAAGGTKPCCAQKKACCGQAQKKACAAGCAKPCCAQKKACCGTCGGQAQKKACATGGTKPCCKQKSACSTGGQHSPMIWLARAECLGLSAEQKAKLKSVLAEAQQRALAILTPEQTARVKAACAQSKSCAPGGTKPCCAQQKACCGTCGRQAQKKSCGPGCTRPCCAQQKACCAASQAESQTVCPVMGLPINKKLSVEYRGKKVYFCCPGCVKKFQENPEKFASKLPQFKP